MKKFFISLMLLVTIVFSQENPRAVIVFDASGSMWGQIDSKAKIEIAKDALKNVVNEWNPKVELGLTVYGHRQKGDCDDIESIVPISTINKSTMISTVNAIKPKGKTPISRSLQKAADELQYTEEKATIILISDGKETCDVDPCAMAKELEEKGIDFVTHVIGFNVDKKTDKQLECIATATGGEYFSAKNATALNEAMKSIVKKVEKVEPEPTIGIKLEITASEKKETKAVEAYHDIYKIGDAKALDNCWSKENKPCIRKVPSGKYLIKSKYNKFDKETTIEINESEAMKVHIVMSETGEVEFTASEKEGGEQVEAYHDIYQIIDGKIARRSSGNCWSKEDKSCIRKIPIGKYLIKSKYNKFNKETTVEVESSKVSKVNIVMGETGEVEFTASQKEGAKLIEAYHDIYQIIDGKISRRSSGNCWSKEDKSCIRKIPIGKYSVHSRFNNLKTDTAFEIKAGEVTKLNIIIQQ